MTRIGELWVYLAASPLAWLAATLVAYVAATRLHRLSGQHPLANPVAIAIALLVALLAATGVPYEVYFDGAQFVHILLGPATVALAVPLYQNAGRVRRMLLPLALGLLAGSLAAIGTAMALTWALGGSLLTMLSMAPKSVTTPIAMGISEKIGGLPSLTAVLVIGTGIAGAMSAPALLRVLRVGDHAVQGLAIGVAAHGIGTARAFQISETAGAFAGLAIGANGLLTALLVPALVAILGLD